MSRHPERQREESWRDESWWDRAACRGTDPELFFPTATHGSAYEAQVAAAKAVCERCPVSAACLADACDGLPDGIAGGLTAGERRALRARHRPGTERHHRGCGRGAAGGGRVVERDARARPGAAGRGATTGRDRPSMRVSVRTVERWAAQQRAGATTRAGVTAVAR